MCYITNLYIDDDFGVIRKFFYSVIIDFDDQLVFLGCLMIQILQCRYYTCKDELWIYKTFDLNFVGQAAKTMKHQYTASYLSLLALLAKIKVFGVLPAHWPLVLNVGNVLVSVPMPISAGFVYCHCKKRWAVLDNTHGKYSGAFCWRL